MIAAWGTEIVDKGEVPAQADAVIREKRNLAPSTRRVNSKGRHGQTGGVANKGLHDLKARLHSGSEVVDTQGHISLKKIIWLNPNHEQPMHQPGNGCSIVVNPPKQNGLITQRDSGPSQTSTGLGRLGCYLIGMVKMGIEIERMIPLEYGRQPGGDSHRQSAGNPTTNTDNLQRRDGSQVVQ